MSDPNAREIGRMDDFDGRRLIVGVDYDTVTIGDWRIDADRIEELMQLLIHAEWAVKNRERDDA